MTRRTLTPKEIRAEAARIARAWADAADGTGNTEAAGEMRDLARRLSRIRLTEERRP